MPLIKAFHADQTGAPTLNGTVGSLIAVLDAVLVDGYNQVNVASITRIGTTVTVTTSTPHGYNNPVTTYWEAPGVNNIARIAGANETQYNGDWAITYVSASVFTFQIATAPATPATGSITTKRAPAGFTKPYSGTNKGVYRSADITSRQHYLQVTDIADCPNGQGARYAGWRGYESMSSMDLGSYPFPTIADIGLFGQYIVKSSTLDATARGWTIYSDGKTFFLVVHADQTIASPTSFFATSMLVGFGDILSTAPDAYGTFICGNTSASTGPAVTTNAGLLRPAGNTSPLLTSGSAGVCLARKYNGQATPVNPASIWGTGLPELCIGGTQFLDYPNPFDNRMYLSQLQIYDGRVLRGALPLYESPHGVQHTNREIVQNIIGKEGRTFAFLRCGMSGGTSGGVYVDLTGPWD